MTDENNSAAPDTSSTTPAEEGSEGSVQAGQQTEHVSGQQGTEGGAEGQHTTTPEETFFDPKSVPPELLPAYKQMQADYTKKTQEIATFKKDAEGWKSNAEKWAKYEKFAPVLEEMLSPDKIASQLTPEMAALEKQLRDAGYSDEAIELMKIGAKFTLDTFNTQRQTETQKAESERQKAWVEGKIGEAAKIDSRLTDEKLTYQIGDETMTFGQIVEQYVMANAEWFKDPVAATQKAIKIVDALIGKAKTEGKDELSASATAKARKFPNTNSSPQGAAGASQPKTIQEAAKEAKKELGM